MNTCLKWIAIAIGLFASAALVSGAWIALKAALANLRGSSALNEDEARQLYGACFLLRMLAWGVLVASALIALSNGGLVRGLVLGVGRLGVGVGECVFLACRRRMRRSRQSGGYCSRSVV